MKLHRNARTTPAARAVLVQRVIHEQWTYAEVAEGSGISIRTVAKWVRRYRQGGAAAQYLTSGYAGNRAANRSSGRRNAFVGQHPAL